MQGLHFAHLGGLVSPQTHISPIVQQMQIPQRQRTLLQTLLAQETFVSIRNKVLGVLSNDVTRWRIRCRAIISTGLCAWIHLFRPRRLWLLRMCYRHKLQLLNGYNGAYHSGHLYSTVDFNGIVAHKGLQGKPQHAQVSNTNPPRYLLQIKRYFSVILKT